MTPEQIGQIIAYIIIGVFTGGVGKMVVDNRQGRKSYKELFTDATAASLEQAEELRDAKDELKNYAALFEQHKRDMDALNGKLDLMEQQRTEQEARHTQQMVEQEGRHSRELAKVATEKDGLRTELERINQRVEEQSKQQKDCEKLEADRDRIAADLKQAEKRIVELEKLVDMLTKPKDTPPTEPDSAPPPVDERPTDADGAKQATVDLPVLPERKEDAA